MAEEKKETKDPQNTKEVKDDKGMPEWLAPVLSSLGGMGGSYMLWIKPLQERMDILANQIDDLREEVKYLKQQNKEYAQELENVNSQLDNNLNGGGYLPIKKSIGQGSYLKKRI